MADSWKDFLWGFAYAFRGIRLAARGRNMRVHILAAFVVAGLAIAFAVTGVQLAVVIVLIAGVMAFETMNTVAEKLCDLVAEELGLPYPDERIKHIKDLAAGAVLLVSIGAAAGGSIIFLPHLL